MSKNSHSLSLGAPCSEKCRFKEHGTSITSVITKRNITDFQLASYINSICKNYAQVLDDDGRSALHMAASCGRRDLCHCLIKYGKGDINLKDNESGYTPLHRSIFYGHINIAVFLIESGAQLQLLDKDDLQASDHAMKDRVNKRFSVHNPCQVYVWGTNNNYTLGTGNQHSRSQPELLDAFRKKNIFIKQVVIDKFHSVFVSSVGRAWACGHGQGGRLGLDTEQTVLTPQPIKTGPEHVVAASLGRNHTLLLMESGSVWTCGSNAHHVLGHSPPPDCLSSPRPLSPKVVKAAGGTVLGVAAARYHSVLWSETTLLSWGLHAGQLGHPRSLQEKTVVTPTLVTGLNLGAKSKIVCVAASVGATVVCVSKGDIYLLHNYQIRRITSKFHHSQQKALDTGITRVAVYGGELNHELDPKLTTKGGDELKIMVLTSSGRLFLWQESFPHLTRCIHPLKRSLTFCELSLSLSSVLLTTDNGEVYIAHIKPKKKKLLESGSKVESQPFNQFLEKLNCHHMTVSRVPHVHRAVAATSDPKGHNFIVLQEHPKVNLTDIPLLEESEFTEQMASLLSDAHEEDSLHDILIEADNGSVPAHHFMLACVSEEFANTARSKSSSPNVTTVKLKGVDVEALRQVLKFAYMHDCDVIHPGPFQSSSTKIDVVKATFELAKRLKMTPLMKCLQLLKYEDGIIVMREGGLDGDLSSLRKAVGERPKYERSLFPSLHDVLISSNDGASFKAHKCILAARLEYFNSMFTGGWVEASATTNLSLPIPQTILREVIDFLYRDEAPELVESQDTDYVSSVLVVADQLFIERLKQLCEMALSGNLSLRNAAYLLQLALTYNADQLKACCMQFIGLNLAAVLESRTLEILDNKTLEELSKYYKNMIPAMSKRVITPFFTNITEEEIITTADAFPVFSLDFEEEGIIDSPGGKANRSNPTPTSSGKKKQAGRPRKTSESQRRRFESGSSNSDLECSTELTTPEKMDFEDLVELAPAEKVDSWVKVDKVQSRLRVIATALTVQPTPQNFTRLSSPTQQQTTVATAPTVQPTPQNFTRLSSPTQQQMTVVSSPPLTIGLSDNREFPGLNYHSHSQPKLASSPKMCHIEIKRGPPVKLSQKQRKKLLAEGEEIKESAPVTPRSAWAPVSPVDSSLTDIMRNTLALSSSPGSEKTKGQIRFSDIMAEEIQQRDNWSKMKSKSLQLTQIEDKAMEELRVFYNAANMFDERISVARVLSANVATPTWITSRHQ